MLKKVKENYRWVIVVACFLLIFAALGICGGNKSLYLAAVPNALGVSRGAYSVSDSIRYLATSLTNLFFGALMMKFGPRKMVVVGMAALSLSCLLNSLAEDLWCIYLAGALLGFCGFCGAGRWTLGF